MRKIKNNQNPALLILFATWFFSVFFMVIAVPATALEKKTIGEVEDIILLPWGITVPARIDTGAATSSLDTCEINVKGKEVEFTLPDRCGGAKYILPLKGWKLVKSASGQARRPVVEIEICIADQKIPTRVTLANRSLLEYAFLLGRNTLREGKFIVDIGLSKTIPPGCQGSILP